MSTKIYEGVRFPRVRLGHFVQLVRERGLERVKERAYELLNMVDVKSTVMKTRMADKPLRSARNHCVDFVLEQIGKAADSSERSLFDLESAWRVWIPKKGKWLLALPHGERANHVKLPSWVESYGYWDNTDPEEDVSDKDWRRRGQDWQIACSPHPKNHQMLIEVFTIEKRTTARGLDFLWLEGKLRGGADLLDGLDDQDSDED